MPKPVVYPSFCSGPLQAFCDYLKEREISVSITFDDGLFLVQSPPDTAEFKVYIQCEPPEVLAEAHRTEIDIKEDTVRTVIERHKYYDLILAWNENILAQCPNAVLFPHCHGLDDNYDLGDLPDKKTPE